MNEPNYASTPARVAASQALLMVVAEHRSLNDVLPDLKLHSSAKDAALIQELCFGVCRYYFSLMEIVAKLIVKPLRRKDQIIEILILTALYQLQHSNTPKHTIINETVAACDGLGRSFAKGLVNACLRRLQREPQLQETTEKQFAHPDWLYARIKQAWPIDAPAILNANNQRPPFTLRVDLRKMSQNAVIEACEGATLHPVVQTAVNLAAAIPVTSIGGFSDGHVSVQDAASQLAAPLLNPQPGMRILDACAAPGGKTVHLLQSCDDLQVLALDMSAKRLQRVQENCQRAKVSAILKAADALNLESWWDGVPFDAILLDAPCSATGVIRRHPDIKLLRQDQDIAELSAIQAQLLEKLVECLKPGGHLLYSTCSVLPEENHLQIQRFLANHSNMRDITAERGVGIPAWCERVPCGMQILPGEMGMDGFYYVLLSKQPTDPIADIQ